jgi:lysophospholipase L1-like esterase
MLLEKNDRFIMAGDSVTDCGRMYESQPGGWGSFGDGYVNLVDGFLAALYPGYHLLVANEGVSGNDIVDLAARWEKDVLSLEPDWVSVMIGVNDVWRQFDGLVMPVRKVLPDEFRDTYRSLIEQTLPRVKGMLLLSPVMIEANNSNPMKQRVMEYAAIARELAEEYHLIYVDIQAKIDAFLAQGTNEYLLCSDRVHPNNKGHAILAKAVLDALEVDWQR